MDNEHYEKEMLALSKKQSKKYWDAKNQAVEFPVPVSPPIRNKPLNPPQEGGTKHDQDKPRIELVDPEFIEGVAEVLTFGARKYAAHNWRSGIDASRLIGAAYRHLGAFNKGEDLDSESGLSHILHAACCLQFLHWTLTHKPEHDDRYKY